MYMYIHSSLSPFNSKRKKVVSPYPNMSSLWLFFVPNSLNIIRYLDLDHCNQFEFPNAFEIKNLYKYPFLTDMQAY